MERSIKTFLKLILICTLSFSSSNADEQNLTYKSIMNSMLKASLEIKNGLLTQNKELIKKHTTTISHHKQPQNNPSLLVSNYYQKRFKRDIEEADIALHQAGDAILKHIERDKWEKAQKAFNELSLTCIRCHLKWKDSIINDDIVKDIKSKPIIKLIRDLPRKDIP